MSKILVSGLVNIETTCSIGNFPINYQPIDYNFFGVNVNVAGVGFNITSALTSLGDSVSLASICGNDLPAKIIEAKLSELNVETHLQNTIVQTPTSVILYDNQGKRRIYCDLKDIQSKTYDISSLSINDYDLVAACNINFNRKLLHIAKENGITIATDVHVIGDVNDEYNKEFMECTDILFLSNEAVIGREIDFIYQIKEKYNNKIIVMGCGSNGAIMYIRNYDKVIHQPAIIPSKIINTVGAGDALFSSFISLYTKGIEPEKCLNLAQKFASNKIGYNGASIGFLSYEELIGNN